MAVEASFEGPSANTFSMCSIPCTCWSFISSGVCSCNPIFMKRTFLILIACVLTLSVSAANKKTEYRLRCTAEAQPLTAHVKDWNANRTYRQLVVLVSFSDCNFSFEDPKSTYDAMFNQTGYNQRDGAGCVADYFRDQSSGLFNLQFDVYGPIKLNRMARSRLYFMPQRQMA